MTIFIIDSMTSTAKRQIMLHCQKVKPHIYVCNISKRVRDELWKLIKDHATMIYQTNSDQGYSIKDSNIKDFDGLQLFKLN